MKRYILLFVIAILLSSGLYSQEAQKSDNCNISAFCLDCGDVKGCYTGDLGEYLTSRIPPKRLKGIESVIMIQVLIDTAGKPCVKNIQNDVPELGLTNLINSMSGWKPAFTNGKPETVSIMVQLKIKDSMIRSSYIRLDGLMIIDPK